MRALLLTLLLAFSASLVAQAPAASRMPSAEQDLAWLNRQLDLEAAARRGARQQQGGGIDFASLGGKTGLPVRISLKDGRSRSGVIEYADAGRVRLRIRLGAGEYLMDVERGDVARITER